MIGKGSVETYWKQWKIHHATLTKTSEAVPRKHMFTDFEYIYLCMLFYEEETCLAFSKKFLRPKPLFGFNVIVSMRWMNVLKFRMRFSMQHAGQKRIMECILTLVKVCTLFSERRQDLDMAHKMPSTMEWKANFHFVEVQRKSDSGKLRQGNIFPKFIAIAPKAFAL